MRSLLLVVVAVGVVGLSAALAGWQQYRQFLSQPLPISESELLVVERGTGFQELGRQLAARGWIDKLWPWRLHARLDPEVARIQAGEYLLASDVTVAELWDMLRTGKVRQYAFTIVEGWTFAELRARISADDRLRHELDASTSAELMAMLGEPDTHPEGRFLPQTYFFVRGDSDLDLYRRSYSAMEDTLDRLWRTRSAELPLDDPEQALILASIVEKETAVEHELAEVAGVFVRRLKKGMLLQTDPTVIYGMGDSFDGNLRKVDLQTDTPYNTYTRPGLPPTPICLPSERAIEAALHPASGDTLFFVARGDGTHAFARSYAEHRRNVARFQLGQR